MNSLLPIEFFDFSNRYDRRCRNMNESLPLFQSSPETESTGTVQFFDCESVPIPPGSKAPAITKRGTILSFGRSLWLVGAGVVVALLFLGMILGKLLHF
jgi:hypothetical protein